MNRLFAVVCMAALLFANAPCHGRTIVCEPAVEVSADSVQMLVELVRNGDAEACRVLAECYRDGKGVEKSFLNSMCMYGLYSGRAEKRVGDDELEGFYKGTHYEIIIEILDRPSRIKESKALLPELEKASPADVKVVKALMECGNDDPTPEVLETLKQAAAEGSEIAVLFQMAYYDKVGDNVALEKALLCYADKYPFFNLQLGRMSLDKFYVSRDVADIERALVYFYKADAHGMVVPRCALEMLEVYEYLAGTPQYKCSAHELERLERLARK